MLWIVLYFHICINTNDDVDSAEEDEVIDMIMQLGAGITSGGKRTWGYFEELDRENIPTPKPSTEEPPELELKPLPSNLKYAFLDPPSSLLVIISALLSGIMEEKILRVLRDNKKAFGWTIHDIMGISPSICTHRIYMKEQKNHLCNHKDASTRT